MIKPTPKARRYTKVIRMLQSVLITRDTCNGRSHPKKGIARPRYTLPYKLTKFLQNHLRKVNVYFHDHVYEECTPCLSCCWHKVPAEYKPRLENLTKLQSKSQ